MVAITSPGINSMAADDLLLHLLRAEVRRQLKDDLMKVAEEVVDAAADRAVAGLEMQISRIFNERHAGDLVKVMVERVRPQ